MTTLSILRGNITQHTDYSRLTFYGTIKVLIYKFSAKALSSRRINRVGFTTDNGQQTTDTLSFNSIRVLIGIFKNLTYYEYSLINVLNSFVKLFLEFEMDCKERR